MRDEHLQFARGIMREFGDATGLTSAAPPRRYLWTDAYAVCNYLALHDTLGDADALRHAVALIEQVHAVLGRHRPDDRRAGWISGLDETAGRRHPTVGGLRIGKPLPERSADDAYDERLEWDRDGQYFHYLTKWMHALYQTALATDDRRYARWARELALTAWRGFELPTSPARLAWKMSIDLRYPLVASSGHHDPLDGLVTILVLRRHATDDALRGAARSLARMCQAQDWTTDDALGIGGLLFDACRLAQLPSAADVDALLIPVLDAAVRGLGRFVRGGSVQQPVTRRLGFRELGLSIGLRGIELLNDRLQRDGRRQTSEVQRQALETFAPLAHSIEQCWLTPANRQQASWTDHLDINEVMLATSLLSPAMLLT